MVDIRCNKQYYIVTVNGNNYMYQNLINAVHCYLSPFSINVSMFSVMEIKASSLEVIPSFYVAMEINLYFSQGIACLFIVWLVGYVNTLSPVPQSHYMIPYDDKGWMIVLIVGNKCNSCRMSNLSRYWNISIMY